MTDPDALPVSLAVLNPNGRDPFIDYAEVPSEPVPRVHAPINFHAFAAATQGAFFDSADEVIAQRERFNTVLVLIRKRTWVSLKAVETLKNAGFTVIVAWKECSESQIAKQLRSLRAGLAYPRILERADGILSPTPVPPPRPSGLSALEFTNKLRTIPTPYPLEFPGWDFSIPPTERRGIFIGTREFRAGARNHSAALTEAAALAHEHRIPRVTVINTEKKSGLKKLQSLAPLFPDGVLQIVPSSLPYLEYLRLLASHRVVFQRDLSGVPGQVAGDCLLARTLCAGGNSAIESIAFPALCDASEGWREQLAAVLSDERAYADALKNAEAIAAERLSFAAAARALREWDVIR